MKIDINTKKVEAIRRLKVLGIFDESIRQFEQGKLSRSEPPMGGLYWIEGDELEQVKEFEHKNNALVYLVVRAYTDFGTLDSFLYVEDEQDEWNYFDEDVQDGIVFTYTVNHETPEFSEFGSIGFIRTPAASILRYN